MICYIIFLSKYEQLLYYFEPYTDRILPPLIVFLATAKGTNHRYRLNNILELPFVKRNNNYSSILYSRSAVRVKNIHIMDVCRDDEPPQKLETHLKQIDRVLANFSETASILRPARDGLWTSTPPPSLDQIVDVYSPVGMKTTFRELYRFLRAHLLQDKTNAAAFLQGTRGTGKSLVLRQCLQALQDEAAQMNSTQAMFRVISVNGIAVPGRNLSAVITEILFQLTGSERGNEKQEKIYDLLRFKKTSSFTNNMQLLTDALEIASSDRIPFLFVLDPLDAFIGTGGHSSLLQSLEQRNKQSQQLLLYYFLDRVASKGSMVSLVGMSSDVHWLRRLEKRTRSRAEAAHFISFGPFPSYEDLIQALLSKLDEYPALQQQLGRFLTFSDTMTTEQENIAKGLLRQYRMGRDMRWFSRVLSLALMNFRQQCSHELDLGKDDASDDRKIKFAMKHLVEAMLDMGVPLPNFRNSNLRIQALADLSSPQAVLILAAKRILTRDTQQKNDDVVVQLTLERILNEYNTAIQKGSLLSNRYPPAQLWRAFQELLEVGLFRPAADVGGRLAFQYMHMDSMYQDVDMNTILTRMPLQMTVDVHREVKVALEQNTIQCSTALREWGLKMN